jgi:hypothetical protein
MRWAVTFGQRYRREDHPTFLPAHPDGYVVIVTDDALPKAWGGGEASARDAAVTLMGSQWSGLYEMDTDEWRSDAAQYYPRGQIGQIEQRHGSWVFVEPHQGPCWCEIGHSHDTEGRA